MRTGISYSMLDTCPLAIILTTQGASCEFITAFFRSASCWG
jgi:hypothetical protein